MEPGISGLSLNISVILVPDFNAMATFAFIDPFRAANYLGNEAMFRWRFFSSHSGSLTASNTATVMVEPLSRMREWKTDIGVISSSWTPEAYYADDALIGAVRRWGRTGVTVCGIDTGAFLMARAGLIEQGRATTHYEHIDSFREVYPKVTCEEDIFVDDGRNLTCGGGVAAVDMALHIIRDRFGSAMANAAARYVLYDRIRQPSERQHATNMVPVGHTTPDKLRHAIELMEEHLEDTLSIPEIAEAVGISQRQLVRLFNQYTNLSVAQYYRNIRLDRGRSLVTQTEMSILSIAVACGFESAEYFSRAYKARFRISPRADRIEGRIPFEYRAWPMHPVGMTKPSEK